MEIIQSEQQEKNFNERKLRDVLNNIKHFYTSIIGVPKGKERRGLKMYLKKLCLKTSQT